MRDDGGGVNHDLTIKIDERLIIDFFQYKMTTEKNQQPQHSVFLRFVYELVDK
jgi:hypothetical protein